MKSVLENLTHPPNKPKIHPPLLILNPAFRVSFVLWSANTRDTHLASHAGVQMVGLCFVVPKEDLAGNCVNNPSFLAVLLYRFLLDLNI